MEVPHLAQCRPAQPRCGLAIECDHAKARVRYDKSSQRVWSWRTDRTVEATEPRRLRDDIPKSDVMGSEDLKPVVVGHLCQFFADGMTEKAPELIPRMSIVAPGSKRRLAGKAAQDQQAGIT